MGNLNLIDYIFVIVIIMGAFTGLRKGFMTSLLSLLGKVIAAYFSVRFLQQFIAYFKIKDLFLKGVVDIVIDYIPLGEQIKDLQITVEGFDLVGTALEGNMFMKIMGESFSREWERLFFLGERIGLSTVGEMIALVIANFIINILSFLVLFFLFLIAFSLVKTVLIKIISASDFASGLDKVLGFVLGAAIDIFLIAIFVGFSFDLLNLVSLKEGGLLSRYINLLNESYLREYFYNIYGIIINEATKLL